MSAKGGRDSDISGVKFVPVYILPLNSTLTFAWNVTLKADSAAAKTLKPLKDWFVAEESIHFTPVGTTFCGESAPAGPVLEKLTTGTKVATSFRGSLILRVVVFTFCLREISFQVAARESSGSKLEKTVMFRELSFF